jgi:colanic acid/amylovoran biosynthesis glycosyltransferase
MLHIYRQITALERVQPVVIAQKRENEDLFPFERVQVVPKPPTHFLRRFWHRQLRDEPWQISKIELDALLRILSRKDARLLHIYFGHIAVHLLPLIQAWSRPSVVSFHGADVLVDMDKPAYRKATVEMLGVVKRVLVRSESLRRALVDLGCDENKIAIMRTGIPLAEFPFRARTWPEDGRWNFIQACRLIPKKGLRTTLKAFAGFAAYHAHASLTIAGDGPLRAELEALTRNLNISSRVSFPGFVSQNRLREMFYASHIFLHPSETGDDGNQEGVPNSMLEAMASGLPVFATNHGGIPEAIENGRSGILVAERDEIALQRALMEKTAEPRELSALATRGAAAIAEKFDRTVQVRNLEEVYLETIR